MNWAFTLTLKKDQLNLIISALENDKVGTWGEDRGARIQWLLRDLKRYQREL
jgi:hypothetical protein